MGRPCIEQKTGTIFIPRILKKIHTAEFSNTRRENQQRFDIRAKIRIAICPASINTSHKRKAGNPKLVHKAHPLCRIGIRVQKRKSDFGKLYEQMLPEMAAKNQCLNFIGLLPKKPLCPRNHCRTKARTLGLRKQVKARIINTRHNAHTRPIGKIADNGIGVPIRIPIRNVKPAAYRLAGIAFITRKQISRNKPLHRRSHATRKSFAAPPVKFENLILVLPFIRWHRVIFQRRIEKLIRTRRKPLAMAFEIRTSVWQHPETGMRLRTSRNHIRCWRSLHTPN